MLSVISVFQILAVNYLVNVTPSFVIGQATREVLSPVVEEPFLEDTAKISLVETNHIPLATKHSQRQLLETSHTAYS
jgi:hypothetical protein